VKNKIKILLTGKNGQLAKTIVSHLKKDYKFISYSKQSLDITKKNEIKKYVKIHKPRFLINTAAYNDVEKAEKKDLQSKKVNCLGVKNLKEICFENNVFLIHFSTDYVFDGKQNTPYEELLKPKPINNYGKSKLDGEKILLSNKKLNFMILRLSWVYSNIGKNFLTKIVKQIKKKNNLNVVSDQFGIPTSTGFVVFYLNKILKEIIKGKKFEKIYHLTPNGNTTWYGFSKIILKFLKKNSNTGFKKINILPSVSNFKGKALRPLYSVMSSKKIQKKLNNSFHDWKFYFRKHCIDK
jgi:dTDP-4-dehydrorhamnose reductase